MRRTQPDPFYTLRELVELRVFGKKSVSHLRRVAQLQRVDRRRYTAKIRMSWGVVDSYPQFVMEGGEWGLYESQIAEHRAWKLQLS